MLLVLLNFLWGRIAQLQFYVPNPFQTPFNTTSVPSVFVMCRVHDLFGLSCGFGLNDFLFQLKPQHQSVSFLIDLFVFHINSHLQMNLIGIYSNWSFGLLSLTWTKEMRPERLNVLVGGSGKDWNQKKYYAFLNWIVVLTFQIKLIQKPKSRWDRTNFDSLFCIFSLHHSIFIEQI